MGIKRAAIAYYYEDNRELYEALLAELFGGLLEPRIGTAKPGYRDERDQLSAIGTELAVSGPEAHLVPAKNPRHGGKFCC